MREEEANDFPGAGLRHAAAIPAAGKRAGTGCKTKIADKSSIDCQRFALYPEPDSPIYYDLSGMVTNFNVSAIYLSWLITKSMPYS